MNYRQAKKIIKRYADKFVISWQDDAAWEWFHIPHNLKQRHVRRYFEFEDIG